LNEDEATEAGTVAFGALVIATASAALVGESFEGATEHPIKESPASLFMTIRSSNQSSVCCSQLQNGTVH
jgi:hypothetical protein